MLSASLIRYIYGTRDTTHHNFSIGINRLPIFKSATYTSSEQHNAMLFYSRWNNTCVKRI